MSHTTDLISADDVASTHELFLVRAKRSPDSIAYRQFKPGTRNWVDYTWANTLSCVENWARALALEQLNRGDRVGIMLRNCREWMIFEQAALRLGLVVVPLYPNDRPDNVAFIINDANIRLMLIEDRAQSQTLNATAGQLNQTVKLISLEPLNGSHATLPHQQAEQWLRAAADRNIPDPVKLGHDELATIAYTSGTTGRPKGVMLSHGNLLHNAQSGIGAIAVYPDDIFLSFLPLSHMLERCVGYYMPIMSGATVAFARSINELSEDLISIRPTILISVPRIFERVYGRIQEQLKQKPPFARRLFFKTLDLGWQRFEHQQQRGSAPGGNWLWPILDHLVAAKVRARLGGRLRFAIAGGAPLALPVAKLFLSLGIPVQQGYGLTEHSPVISVNPLNRNRPDSIGIPLPGVSVRLSKEGELQARSKSVMLGYWRKPEATAQTITEDGWLRTGDLARKDGEHIFITGRIKDILVLSNGEKVPPADMEMAILLNPLFEQAVVIGEGKPYLTALLVVQMEQWNSFAVSCHCVPDQPGCFQDPRVTAGINAMLSSYLAGFPGYAKIRRFTLLSEPWTVESGLLTPTLKPKRAKITEHFHAEIERMYEGHN